MIGEGFLNRWTRTAYSILMLAGLLLEVVLPAAAEPVSVSLESWLSAALQQDPQVAEARAESNWESSRAGAVRVWEDPELRLGRENREDDGDQTSVRLRVPLPNPWAARAQQNRADARAAGESARTEAIAWERRMELSSLYFEAVYSVERSALREALLTGLDADLRDAERGFEANLISRSRIIDLRGERALVAARLAKDALVQAGYLEEMRTRAGWKENTILALATPLPDPESLNDLPTLETLRSMAFREQGVLAALAAEQREDEALRAEARARAIPWITYLEGTWVREADGDRDDFEARIAISLPVFSMLRRSQSEEAIRLVRTRDRIRAYSTAIEAALQAARHRAEASARRLRAVFEATAPSLREIDDSLSASTTDPRTRAGLRDLAFDLESERLEAVRDYQMAILDLMLVAGPDMRQVIHRQ